MTSTQRLVLESRTEVSGWTRIGPIFVASVLKIYKYLWISVTINELLIWYQFYIFCAKAQVTKLKFVIFLDLLSFSPCSGLPHHWVVQPDAFFICWPEDVRCSLMTYHCQGSIFILCKKNLIKCSRIILIPVLRDHSVWSSHLKTPL